MAIYTIDIQKRLGSEFWTNRYLCQHANIGNATGLAIQLVADEIAIHNSLVTFVNYRVSALDINDDTYTIGPIGESGGRPTPGLLPLFNTLRFDLQATSGRPSRKYYRGVLTESDINGDEVTIQTAFADHAQALLALSVEPETPIGLCDPQGQAFVAVVVHPFVQMRQLRRGTRRRGTPVFQ